MALTFRLQLPSWLYRDAADFYSGSPLSSFGLSTSSMKLSTKSSFMAVGHVLAHELSLQKVLKWAADELPTRVHKPLLLQLMNLIEIQLDNLTCNFLDCDSVPKTLALVVLRRLKRSIPE